MPEDFKVEIPISVKGGAGAGAGDRTPAIKELEELNKGIKKLDKTMILNIDVIEIMSSLLGGLRKILEPLFRLLSLMLLIIFLPLMPIYKDLIKGLSAFAKFLGKITSPLSGVDEDTTTTQKVVMGLIRGIFIAIGIAIVAAVFGWVVAILVAVALIIILFWEDIANILIAVWNELIVPAFEFLAMAIMFVWEQILKPAWEFLKDVGLWIWNQIIKPSWEFLKDVGVWIWDIISAPFRWLADKIKSIWDFFSGLGGGLVRGVKGIFGFGDFIQRPGQAPTPFSSQDTIIGVKNPASLGGGTVININNPIVRQSSDIKLIANEVSKVLQRQMSGRISSR